MGNTIYDRIYKMLQEDFPQLMIPLVNEQFHTNYDLTEPVINRSQELHTIGGKLVMDSLYSIGNRLYHTECQSNPDGSIVIRMLEYDFFTAIKNVHKNEEGIYQIELPRSSVIYLRQRENTLQKEQLEIYFPDGEKKTYVVPIIKVQDYSVEEIFEKKLYMLLPYYVMRYEKDKRKWKQNPQKLKELEDEYQTMLERLEKDLSEGNENQRLLTAIESAIMSVSAYTFRKDKVLQEKIGGVIMRGNKYKPLYKVVDELQEENVKLEARMQGLEVEKQGLEAEKQGLEAEKQGLQREKKGLELQLKQSKKFTDKILELIHSGKSLEEIEAFMMTN